MKLAVHISLHASPTLIPVSPEPEESLFFRSREGDSVKELDDLVPPYHSHTHSFSSEEPAAEIKSPFSKSVRLLKRDKQFQTLVPGLFSEGGGKSFKVYSNNVIKVMN